MKWSLCLLDCADYKVSIKLICLFQVKGFVDIRKVRAVAGKGGDGEVSFLQLWANDSAGPDGGDGGNGGHVIVQVKRQHATIPYNQFFNLIF